MVEIEEDTAQHAINKEKLFVYKIKELHKYYP